MNLALLLVGFRVWTGAPLHVITKVLCAASVLSLEMQLATWTGLATLRSLILVNLVVAGALLWGRREVPAAGTGDAWTRWARYVGAGAVALALLVAIVNLALPLASADAYHLPRVEQIERLGTLAYDPAADPKVNVLGWVYELVLADVRQIPVVGDALVRVHGLVGVALYALTALALLSMLEAPPSWCALVLFVVPVVFHQLVLIKNDLFVALPSVLVLTWIVARLDEAPPIELAWAGWLTGLAVAIKLTSFPLVVVLAAAVLASGRGVSAVGAASVGALVGLVAGGLLFTLLENARTYGDGLEPLRRLGNRTADVRDAATSLGRFVISLFDFGLLTRAWWPGRGGWGSTYGLPVVWALAAVCACARQVPVARRALFVAVAYWLLFAAIYPDADVAHRLALAPGLMLIATACAMAGSPGVMPLWLRRLAVPITALSAVQIVRSTALYLSRS